MTNWLDWIIIIVLLLVITLCGALHWYTPVSDITFHTIIIRFGGRSTHLYLPVRYRIQWIPKGKDLELGWRPLDD